MSQDIVADALNQIMNIRRAGKLEAVIKRHSKLLLSVLAIAKMKSYVKEYKVTPENELKITLGQVNSCGAIKPRYLIQAKDIEKYVTRYLPSRHIGVLIISTSQGLMTHQTALDKNLGGSLIAYMY
ncbi:30S ribosomal protein S8 [Candidatus Pacearchaeota archaeon]|nr:30S ribosomal protein S8 [Candidatus Pacearchaeota archaeon]